MSNNNTGLTFAVIAFAAFIIADLANTPAFVQDVYAERKNLKKPKKSDCSSCGDLVIEEPIVKSVNDKAKKENDYKPGKTDLIIDSSQ